MDITIIPNSPRDGAYRVVIASHGGARHWVANIRSVAGGTFDVTSLDGRRYLRASSLNTAVDIIATWVVHSAAIVLADEPDV